MYYYIFSKIKTKGMIELAQAIKDEDDREIKEAATAAASRVSTAISNIRTDVSLPAHT